MIETVIKCGGRKEEFSAAKLNQWGAWAADKLKYVDWSGLLLSVMPSLPKTVSTKDLQMKLIKSCLEEGTWSYNLMAGRLYAPMLYKEAFGKKIGELPTVAALHTKLVKLGLMVDLGYSKDEYEQVESIIDHNIDLHSAYYELHQTRTKYGIKNSATGKFYETQQFMYMRMAMALASQRFSGEDKMEKVKEFYEAFSQNLLNCPTPNHVNLGTPHNGYASCCVYTTNDSAKSLAIGDHIAYTMTCMSAGIGAHIRTRSLGDPIRGGAIEHSGKLPYYRSLVGAISANLQNGRGGAATTYFTAYDPEVRILLELKNPMSTEDRKIRGMDYSFSTNKFFARAVALDEEIALFSCFDQPDLYEAQYDKDLSLFDKLYEDYLNDGSAKDFARARDLVISSISEAFETGRSYMNWMDEMNRHTPFKDKIYSSNLCLETSFPTAGYDDMMDLYSTEDHGRGEIGLCSLAAINVGNVKSDEEYGSVAYLALLMIDICTDLSHYELPHLGVTAKARRNAGVGVVGLAYHMAKEGLEYSSQAGRDHIHTLAETHAWHLYNASLRLGKEYGNAKWMHKTEWPSGWTPLSTYNKNVDELVTVENKRDWAWLSDQIVANGGIRNSVCVNYMPAEASSKASGTTNSVYPVRELALKKTDDKSITYWAAPEGERLRNSYQSAWDIPTEDMISIYAIIQKWTDQQISADLYRKIIGDDTVTTDEMIGDYLRMTKYGMKSRYYQNSKTSEGREIGDGSRGCSGGACTL